MLEISVISRMRSTNKIADLCNTFDELFLVFTEKMFVCLFFFFFFFFFLYFCFKGKNLTFYLVIARSARVQLV